MRATAWLAETVAASRSRLNGSIANVAVLLFRRVQIQSPIAKRIAKESARKKFVVVTSLSVKSEPLIRRAPDAEIRATSPTTNASAAIRMPRRQKSSTGVLALAGSPTARRYATPPSSNASKASVAARSRTVSRSISRRNQIKVVLGSTLFSALLYLEGDRATSDVSIRSQDLPTQHIRSFDEPGQLGSEQPGRWLAIYGNFFHLAVRGKQCQGRVLQIDP